MTHVSIDQSLSKTAAIVWEDGEPVEVKVFKTGSLSAKKHIEGVRHFDSDDERIDHICEELWQLVGDNQPCTVSMEGLSFGSTGNVARQLAGLYFTIRNSLYNGTELQWNQFYSISPTSAKSFARDFLPIELQTVPKPSGKAGTNKVKMDKHLMIKAVPEVHSWVYDGYKMSGKMAGLDDICDAYWIGRYWHKSLNK